MTRKDNKFSITNRQSNYLFYFGVASVHCIPNMYYMHGYGSKSLSLYLLCARLVIALNPELSPNCVHYYTGRQRNRQ